MQHRKITNYVCGYTFKNINDHLGKSERRLYEIKLVKRSLK